MKTLIRSLAILFVFLIAVSYQANSQTTASFTGTVTFNITYTGNIDAATLAQQPKVYTVKIMGNKLKGCTDYGQYIVYDQTDADKKELTIFIEQMGAKVYTKFNEAEISEIQETRNGSPEIVYTDSTKTVAGYTCKKAEYKTTGEDGTQKTNVAFYTEELGGEQMNWGSDFQGLKGYPLQFTSVKKDFTVTYTATLVKKGKVKDIDFLIPTDYVEGPPEMKEQLKALLLEQE
jgi:hypothetical protein